jgi:hypothetical protein
VLIIWYFYNRWNVSLGLAGDRSAQSARQAGQYYNSVSSFDQGSAQVTNKVGAAEDVLARMRKLNELRAANLISKAEYEQKRAEILRKV